MVADLPLPPHVRLGVKTGYDYEPHVIPAKASLLRKGILSCWSKGKRSISVGDVNPNVHHVSPFDDMHVAKPELRAWESIGCLPQDNSDCISIVPCPVRIVDGNLVGLRNHRDATIRHNLEEYVLSLTGMINIGCNNLLGIIVNIVGILLWVSISS